MRIRVIVTKDFDGMSAVAAELAGETIRRTLAEKKEAVLGLATGNSPTGLYRLLARAANAGEFDAARIRSFNLDEYVGLPGENAQARVLHPQSYSYFMIQEFFSLLRRKFAETCVPSGNLIDQARFEAERRGHPGDWTLSGGGAGRSVVIKARPRSEYLAWIRHGVLEAYERKIKAAGGIDLQVIGCGGRGHVAFHEAGIPFAESRVLLVQLDDDTVRNAVADGHFATEEECPRFAVSMGAELVYEARHVLFLASGERKRAPVTRSLLEDASPEVPVSYGQIYAQRGGDLVYVVDEAAGADLLGSASVLADRNVELEDRRG